MTINTSSYKAYVSRLVTFGIDGNAVMDADKPTRTQIRRFRAHEKSLQAMAQDPIFGTIARNRLECLEQALDYVKTGSEISRKKSIKLHSEGDRLIDALLANGVGQK